MMSEMTLKRLKSLAGPPAQYPNGLAAVAATAVALVATTATLLHIWRVKTT